jgi:outer membrane protein assembly factor BamB
VRFAFFDVRHVLGLSLFLTHTAANATAANAQEWTRFRGPNGSGISRATTLPTQWTDKDLNWKIKLPGRGHSSPVLWGERIFVTSGDEKTGARTLVCLNTNGQHLWKREFPGMVSGKHEDNSFASATPAVDERHVYVAWGNAKEYLVIALDHAGNEVWRIDLGPFRAGHGFGPSPIVHDDLVVLANDQDGASSAVALACATGKVSWRVPRRSKSSYATPCVYRPKGRPAELIFVSYEHGITALDPATGRIKWERDIFSKDHVECTIASPIVAGNLVIGTSGWMGVKYETVALRPYDSTKGKEPVYRVERLAPLVPTPLVKDDLLFLWHDRGVVACADVRTGELHWRERVPGSFYGSPVCAGDKLYCLSREGEAVVVAAKKQFQLLARNPLGEGSHSTPALAGGRMYLRTFTHLMSVGGNRQAK